MRNVEIKAKVKDVKKICSIAESLSKSTGEVIKQHDVFYNVLNGRLKMRFFEDKSATLVRYDRVDGDGPKLSDYDLLSFTVEEANKAEELHEILCKSLNVKGHVRKKRTLYLMGQTRIHIDEVENLGNYMELEVVLNSSQSLEDGQQIAKDIQTKLEVRDEDLIKCAYVDILLNK